MGLGDAFEARDELVDAGVVLHGAGAERIHAEVDGEVPRGEAGEVADDFDLADLWHEAEVGACGGAEFPGCVNGRDVELVEAVGFLAGRGLFKDHGFVLIDVA